MTEKDKILNNNNGELPNGVYDIIKVTGIRNPVDELNIFKQTMIAFLDNRDLHEEDKTWNTLLPKKLVRFTEQLEEEDYHKDDLISHIPTMIYKLKTIREWVWHSSKLTTDGFDVIVEGIFRGIFLPLLHHQGIPHKNLFIQRGNDVYPTRVLTDILTYKTFDPVTFKLERAR